MCSESGGPSVVRTFSYPIIAPASSAASNRSTISSSSGVKFAASSERSYTARLLPIVLSNAGAGSGSDAGEYAVGSRLQRIVRQLLIVWTNLQKLHESWEVTYSSLARTDEISIANAIKFKTALAA